MTRLNTVLKSKQVKFYPAPVSVSALRSVSESVMSQTIVPMFGSKSLSEFRSEFKTLSSFFTVSAQPQKQPDVMETDFEEAKEKLQPSKMDTAHLATNAHSVSGEPLDSYMAEDVLA